MIIKPFLVVGKPFGGVVLGFGFGCSLGFFAVFWGERGINLFSASRQMGNKNPELCVAALHVYSITTFSVEIAVFGSISLQQLTNYYELEIMGALW